MAMNSVQCPSCKAAVAVTAFLDACSHFWADLNLVRFTCPSCKQRTDAQLMRSLVSLGYVYAAGSPHFCGMIEMPIDGLCARRDGDDLVVELGGATWRIAPITRRT